MLGLGKSFQDTFRSAIGGGYVAVIDFKGLGPISRYAMKSALIGGVKGATQSTHVCISQAATVCWNAPKTPCFGAMLAISLRLRTFGSFNHLDPTASCDSLHVVHIVHLP